MSNSGGQYPRDFATATAVTIVCPGVDRGSSCANPKSPNLAVKCLSRRILDLENINMIIRWRVRTLYQFLNDIFKLVHKVTAGVESKEQCMEVERCPCSEDCKQPRSRCQRSETPVGTHL